eukprot:11161331-Lingulodinium_polyedra.AAC.1
MGRVSTGHVQGRARVFPNTHVCAQANACVFGHARLRVRAMPGAAEGFFANVYPVDAQRDGAHLHEK